MEEKEDEALVEEKEDEEEESTDGLGLDAEDRLDDDLEDRREFPPFEFLPLPLTSLLLLLLLVLLFLASSRTENAVAFREDAAEVERNEDVDSPPARGAEGAANSELALV